MLFVHLLGRVTVERASIEQVEDHTFVEYKQSQTQLKQACMCLIQPF